MAKRRRSGCTLLISCILGAIFLVFVVIVIAIVYFTVLKPQDPEITLEAAQFPSFSTLNTSVRFTFSQNLTLRNPNRAPFEYNDGSLQLICFGNPIAAMPMPAGEVSAGMTVSIFAYFPSLTLPLGPFTPARSAFPGGGLGLGMPGTIGFDAGGFRVGPILEMESRVRMEGRVRLLWIFKYPVDALASCRVDVSVLDGSVLGFHC